MNSNIFNRWGNLLSNNELQSEIVEWLRFPMSVMVVFIHYYGKELINQPELGTCIYDSVRILLCHVISRAAVPTFFVISGYYFFYNSHFNLTIYKQKLKKRFNTLFVPYMLWNIIMLLSVIAFKLGAYFIKGKSLCSITDYLSENGWLKIFWCSNEWNGLINWFGKQMINTSPVLVPMWFVRDLMVVVVIAPLIYWACKRMKWIFILLLLLCYMSAVWTDVPGFSITAMFYFSLGAFFAIDGKNIVTEFRKAKIMTHALTIVLLPIMVYLDGQYTRIGNFIYPFFVFILTVEYFNIAALMVEHDRLLCFKAWGKASFFIFAMHTVYVLNFSEKIMYIVIPSDVWILAILRYMLIPLLCTAICYGLFIAMHCFTPRTLVLLTGSRTGNK